MVIENITCHVFKGCGLKGPRMPSAKSVIKYIVANVKRNGLEGPIVPNRQTSHLQFSRYFSILHLSSRKVRCMFVCVVK